MDFIAKLLGRDYKYYEDRAKHMAERNDWGYARLEALKALELVPEQSGEAQRIQAELEKYEKALMEQQLAQAGQCRENGAVEDEIGFLENALEILPDNRKHELAEALRDAHERLRAVNIDDLAFPHLKRGDDFLSRDMPSEALVEFKEALKMYGDIDDDLKSQIREKAAKAENLLVLPYLQKAEELLDNDKPKEAWGELERARALATDCGKEINKKIDKLYKRTGIKDSKGDDTEFVPREIWDAAIEEYMRAVEAYFAFGTVMDNPYLPAHRNSCEKAYREARRRLGGLYIQRADGYFAAQKYRIALKEYQESLKYFTKDDVGERTHILDRLRMIRAQRK